MITANKARLDAAVAMIQSFRQGGGGLNASPRKGASDAAERSPAGWPMTRQSLAEQLAARLAGKDEPNQRSTSYCGPAAFLYCLLEDRPDLYVAYAIGLWERGTYDFAGGKGSLHVTSHSGARGAMQQLAKARISSPATTVSDLDWMTMSSLSTSTRYFDRLLGSPKPTDEGAAISYPWVVRGWFNAIGAPPRVDTMGWGAVPISLATFLNLMNSWSSCWIVLQIDVSLLNGGSIHFFSGRHWVVVDPHRPPMVRDGGGKVVPLGEAARDIWKVPQETLEQGDVLDGPLMKDWPTNLRLVSWGRENYAMSEQKLRHLVSRVYGGYAIPHFR